ncbi:MAG: twin-arginine translocation pathway signal protein [Brevundimonas sp.]|uniref:YHS domain-containing (seleno)protein n=1 Tax=Brevundimonas sp. TaxID=1871086 RepID=UPI001A359724|nr:YHS domain-containing (seleno)protein [Brevundimonas sp.]MBJ7448610.1 twin-arginine translocation pathway signal protein [Brevundimonas sp.]
MLRFVLASLMAVSLTLIVGSSQASTQSRTYPPVYAAADRLSLGGHDPVAYFTDGQPVAGDPAITLDWNGATWRFATAENRTMFEANPQAYAPQFGGYCAWAASQGYIAPGDPTVWRIVDGRLYLNFNDRARMLWEQDIPGAIARGEANWPRILTDNQG